MYLKEHFIRFLKIKNVLFLIIGIFLASMSVAIIIELIVYYFGDWYTILTARSMPESVFFIFFGAFLIVCSRISRRLINDAGFYSSYFETSLSGYISCHELSAVTGKSVSAVTARLPGPSSPATASSTRITEAPRASAPTAAAPTSLPRSSPATASTAFRGRPVRRRAAPPSMRGAP